MLSSIFIVLSMLFTSANAALPASPDCITCHEQVYLKAIESRYQHSILKDKCIYCHIRQTDKGEVITTLSFSTFQKEQVVYLQDIPGNLVYAADAMVTDNEGNKSLPRRVKMDPEELWDRSEGFESLKAISNATINEISKGAFVKAVITWDTNAYSTSEVEYKTVGGRKAGFNSGDIFTKKHRVVLYGLKHKSVYTFKVISRDIYGLVLESKEYSFDTSKNVVQSEEGEYKPPAITHIQAFTLEGVKGLFLKVFANKPSELSIRLMEVNGAGEKHGFGLQEPRFASIDICIKCHPRGTSHPVGVRAKGIKIRTPEELPTIEDGIITCATCHNPHGGDNAFFARYDRNKDICIICHIGGY